MSFFSRCKSYFTWQATQSEIITVRVWFLALIKDIVSNVGTYGRWMRYNLWNLVDKRNKANMKDVTNRKITRKLWEIGCIFECILGISSRHLRCCNLMFLSFVRKKHLEYVPNFSFWIMNIYAKKVKNGRILSFSLTKFERIEKSGENYSLVANKISFQRGRSVNDRDFVIIKRSRSRAGVECRCFVRV